MFMMWPLVTMQVYAAKVGEVPIMRRSLPLPPSHCPTTLGR